MQSGEGVGGVSQFQRGDIHCGTLDIYVHFVVYRMECFGSNSKDQLCMAGC